MKPYPAIRVANYFIKKGLEEGGGVSPMKVQKLTYFAHGWHLALYDSPLIDEDIQAWTYGPVIPSLYHKLKGFGNLAIDRPLPEVSGRFSSREVVREVEERDGKFLDFIWRLYGKYSAVDLSVLTHVSDSPWDRAMEANKDAEMRNVPIDNEWIKEYFSNQFELNGQQGEVR